MVVAVVWRCTGRCWLFLGFELRGGVGNDGVPLEKPATTRGPGSFLGHLVLTVPPLPRETPIDSGCCLADGGCRLTDGGSVPVRCCTVGGNSSLMFAYSGPTGGS